MNVSFLLDIIRTDYNSLRISKVRVADDLVAAIDLDVLDSVLTVRSAFRATFGTSAFRAREMASWARVVQAVACIDSGLTISSACVERMATVLFGVAARRLRVEVGHEIHVDV